jgi:hypothetical protein
VHSFQHLSDLRVVVYLRSKLGPIQRPKGEASENGNRVPKYHCHQRQYGPSPDGTQHANCVEEPLAIRCKLEHPLLVYK